MRGTGYSANLQQDVLGQVSVLTRTSHSGAVVRGTGCGANLQQDVLGLHVPVRDAVLVADPERREHLPRLGPALLP